MKRITLNITDEQFASLKERARVTGVPQSEQIRRALAAVHRAWATAPSRQPSDSADVVFERRSGVSVQSTEQPLFQKTNQPAASVLVATESK